MFACLCRAALEGDWPKGADPNLQFSAKILGLLLLLRSPLDRANGRGGFGSQTAADPLGDPQRTLKSRPWVL